MWEILEEYCETSARSHFQQLNCLSLCVFHVSSVDFLSRFAECLLSALVPFMFLPPILLRPPQPLGIEETKGLVLPLFFLVSVNLLFNNWAKDQVRVVLLLVLLYGMSSDEYIALAVMRYNY